MQKINIAELLRNCPKDMELDCTMYNKVTLLKVDDREGIVFPIRVMREDGNSIALTKYGQYTNADFAKCIIFPKGKTTWEGFQRPFKDGDIISGKNGACSYITIFRKFLNDTSFSHHACLTSFGNFKVDDFSDNANLRLATEEEKAKLFQAIKANGYKWNSETKILEKLVGPKFKIEKGKWYVCIKDLLDRYANKAFCKGDIYYSPEDEYLIPGNSNVPSKVEYYIDEYFRDWTIQDAKDGDVLIDKVYHGEFPFLFKEAKPSDIKTDYPNPLTILGYCGIGKVGFTKGKGWGDTANCTYYPAAKEQRDFLFQKIKEAGYKWNPETKTLEKLLKFKDGDIVAHGSVGCAQVFIFKEYVDIENNYAHCYIMLDNDGAVDFEDGFYYVERFATKEETKELFDTINAGGLHWNAETKTLEKLPKFKVGDTVKHIPTSTSGMVVHVDNKGYYIDYHNVKGICYTSFTLENDYELIPNKFNINTLKPFESRVLVRHSKTSIWMPAIFGGYNDLLDISYYAVGGTWWRYCIPFKGNEHLRGTNDDCNDYYKTWK